MPISGRRAASSSTPSTCAEKTPSWRCSQGGGIPEGKLSSLLYKDRLLLDYFDKNLSIFPAEDWKCFGRTRDAFRRRLRSGEEIAEVEEEVLRLGAGKGGCLFPGALL